MVSFTLATYSSSESSYGSSVRSKAQAAEREDDLIDNSLSSSTFDASSSQ